MQCWLGNFKPDPLIEKDSTHDDSSKFQDECGEDSRSAVRVKAKAPQMTKKKRLKK